MKEVISIAEKLKPLLNRTENPRIIHFEIIKGKCFKLPVPIFENEMTCARCGYDLGYVSLNEPGQKELGWFCSKQECIKHSAEISKKLEKDKWVKKIAKVNPMFECLIPKDEISHFKPHWLD